MQRSTEQSTKRPSVQPYSVQPFIDYLSAEGSVDAPFGGVMYEEELNRKHETALLQKMYRIKRKENDDTMHYLLPRETLAEKRARLEALLR